MRKFIDTISQLFEKTYEINIVHPKYEKTAKIYENPNIDQVNNLLKTSGGRLRFLLDKQNILYVWDSGKAIHHDIIMNLGLESTISGFINSEGIGIRCKNKEVFNLIKSILKASKNIEKALGFSFQVFESDDI
jgi:hypothetical protein